MKLLNSWLMASAISTVAARPWPRAVNTTSTYFFTFGNSYTQTGFSTTGEQPSPSNPMGNPTLGTGTTTGGENWVGYLTTGQNASLVLSYNLAVGGASIDNSLVQGSTDVDLASQVDIFDETYSIKPASAPWSADNSVFGFWIGINDIGNAFYNTDANTFTPKLIARLASLVEQIYSAGGRKFLFLNVPPTSRSPMFINQGNATVEQHAAYLAVYNKNLESMVDEFKINHTDVTVAYYDSWSFMTKILDNPTDYGFPDATCINEDGTSCVWWNDYHPSAKYHQLQAGDMKKVLQPLGAW
ncbi:GDSL lipase/esterase [Aspergillus pseudotamarii]|uniref:GDSL lipase/esterase n=1 Tax=Aspergillus pseudotamarii TaxID=132259 RepID=A0A5N6SQR0_ASPPS|nr:GDSL lipase/esterase [Aspergillus pseudotamarii]KAE8136237.1 GDSL lipase/esterase [Aspergillus pseudotamarii]